MHKHVLRFIKGHIRFRPALPVSFSLFVLLFGRHERQMERYRCGADEPIVKQNEGIEFKTVEYIHQFSQVVCRKVDERACSV